MRFWAAQLRNSSPSSAAAPACGSNGSGLKLKRSTEPGAAVLFTRRMLNKPATLFQPAVAELASNRTVLDSDIYCRSGELPVDSRPGFLRLLVFRAIPFDREMGQKHYQPVGRDGDADTGVRAGDYTTQRRGHRQPLPKPAPPALSWESAADCFWPPSLPSESSPTGGLCVCATNESSNET